MTRWLGPAAWGKREAKAGARLPYAAHWNDSTLLLRDGGLMQSLSIAGMAFETEDADQLNHMLGVREVMLRSVLDARFVLYHHIIRRRVDVGLEGDFESPFAGELDRQWRARLGHRQLFVNEQFITLVRRPPRGKTGWPERVARWFSRREVDVDPSVLRELDAATRALVASLQPYGARLLGSYKTPHGTCSEPLELLSALYNGEMRPVVRPALESDIGHHIPYTRISFGLDTLELQRAGHRSFAGLLSVKDYPATTRAGLIDGVLRLGCECVLTESFAPADGQVARERIDLAIRRLRAADDDTATERREMLSAKDALVSGQTGFGDHHLTLLVRAPTMGALDGVLAEASSALADIGAIVVREDVNLEPGFWAQFPGNEDYVVRRALISTSNAAGFISLHGFPIGTAEGNHWGRQSAYSRRQAQRHISSIFTRATWAISPSSVLLGRVRRWCLISLQRRLKKPVHGPFFLIKIAAQRYLFARLAAIMLNWSRGCQRDLTHLNYPIAPTTALFWSNGWLRC